jgi:hypothetical protein
MPDTWPERPNLPDKAIRKVKNTPYRLCGSDALEAVLCVLKGVAVERWNDRIPWRAARRRGRMRQEREWRRMPA